MWQDFRNGNYDIYLYEFTTDPVAEIQELVGAVDAFFSNGSIDNGGIVESLRAFLDQAEAAIARGDNRAVPSIPS